MKAACRAVVAASLLLPAVAGASALDSDLRAALAALARGEDVSTALDQRPVELTRSAVPTIWHKLL